MVSSPHRLVSSMKGGEQILSSGDRGEARVSTACSTGPLSTAARPIQQPTPRSHPWRADTHAHTCPGNEGTVINYCQQHSRKDETDT